MPLRHFYIVNRLRVELFELDTFLNICLCVNIGELVRNFRNFRFALESNIDNLTLLKEDQVYAIWLFILRQPYYSLQELHQILNW